MWHAILQGAANQLKADERLADGIYYIIPPIDEVCDDQDALKVDECTVTVSPANPP